MTTAQQSPAAIAQELAERNLAPNAAAIDRERRFPAENLKAIGASGLMGLLVPTVYGGMSGSLSDLAAVEAALGAGCASTAMCFLMHSCGASVIAAKASPQQGEAWLRPAARGDNLATLAFSERVTGAHFYAPDLSLATRNGGFVLNGQKSFITNGGHADLYPVLVNSPSGTGLDIFVLKNDASGVAFSGSWDGLGMAGNSSISATFTNVALSEADRLGNAGDGMELVFNVVAPTFLIGLAGVNIGIAKAALDGAVEHAKNRSYASGQRLAEVPAIERYLAEMATALESARQLMIAAGAAADRADPMALPLLIEAKIAATEAAQSVTDTAMQVGGGQAYGRGLPLERHWRDARAGSVMAPTNDVLKEWLGKVLTGLPLF